MTEREQLEKRLEEIKEQEYNKYVDAVWPEFEKMKGKCFRKKEQYNSRQHWSRYMKIIELTKDDVYFGGVDRKTPLAICKILSFQKTCGGQILIDVAEHSCVHCLGKEISEEKFNEEFRKIKNEINNI